MVGCPGSMVLQLYCKYFGCKDLLFTMHDFSTTPTIEMAVKNYNMVVLLQQATIRHNGTLKLLNKDGEFINASLGEELIQIASEKKDFLLMMSINWVLSLM